MLTRQDVAQAMPAHMKGVVSDELVDTLNQIAGDPELADTIRDNFLTHTAVLKEGRFKIGEYLNAVTYVSFRLMGYTNQESYARTFPARYQALMAKGTANKDLSAYVAGYSKGKLVNLILEQSLIPSWVLNQDVYQKAIKTQLELMVSAKSEKVRSEAANSILTHLKPPEKKQIQLSIDVAQNSGLSEMKDMLHDLALQQQQLISQGVTTREIAHQKLVRTVSVPEDAVVVEPSGVPDDDDSN